MKADWKRKIHSQIQTLNCSNPNRRKSWCRNSSRLSHQSDLAIQYHWIVGSVAGRPRWPEHGVDAEGAAPQSLLALRNKVRRTNMLADKIVRNETAAAPEDALSRQGPSGSFREVSSCGDTEEAATYVGPWREQQGTSDSAEEASSSRSVDNQGGELIQWRQQSQPYEEY
jgi:hypothetical protein